MQNKPTLEYAPVAADGNEIYTGALVTYRDSEDIYREGRVLHAPKKMLYRERYGRIIRPLNWPILVEKIGGNYTESGYIVKRPKKDIITVHQTTEHNHG